MRASFKADDWPRRAGGPFDWILSMQAVHELRHKRRAARLYVQAREVLSPGGRILICDHTPFDDTPRNTTLYMTEHEQLTSLTRAGFENARVGIRSGSLVVYVGER